MNTVTQQLHHSQSALINPGLLYRRNLGWSVVPIKPGEKQPPMNWQKFQHRPPDEDQICSWADEFPDAGIGVVTGRVSGIVGLDVDGEIGRQSLKNLDLKIGGNPICQTARGFHIYFKHPGFRVGNGVGLLPGIDFRGDGGLLVAPPSTHVSGSRYEWLVPPTDASLSPLPDRIVRLLSGKPSEPNRCKVAASIIQIGKRNQSLFQAACGFARNSHTIDHLVKRVMALNLKRCQVPLDIEEVMRLCLNAAKLAGLPNIPSPFPFTSLRPGSKQRLTPVLRQRSL